MAGMTEAKYVLMGVSPMIQHNGRGADPLDPVVRLMRRLTDLKGKAKTDEVLEKMSRVEWVLGLYHNGEDIIDTQKLAVSVSKGSRVIVPSMMIEAVINAGARKTKQGKRVTASVIVPDDSVLDYQGSNDINKLSNDRGSVLRVSVKVGQSRVMRTRPIFREWYFETTVQFDQQNMNEDEIFGFLQVAGREKGIGDWRPKFGRFEVSRA